VRPSWLAVRGGKSVKVGKKAADDDDEDADVPSLVSGKPGPAKTANMFWRSFFDPNYEETLKPKKKKKSKKSKKKAPKVSRARR